jgi:hypothetical protein
VSPPLNRPRNAAPQQVGGNAALALLLTVASNSLGVFTMPFLLPALLGPSLGGVGLEPLPLLAKLVQNILLPTMFGAAVRAFVPGASAQLRRRPVGLAWRGARGATGRKLNGGRPGASCGAIADRCLSSLAAALQAPRRRSTRARSSLPTPPLSCSRSCRGRRWATAAQRGR